MEFEEIYDDVQVTTHPSSGDDNEFKPSDCYEEMMPASSAPAEYTNLSSISKSSNADQLYRTGYKSLLVMSGEDATKNEYAIANQSVNFSLNESSNNGSNELVHKPSKPPVPKKYVSQRKNVSINEPLVKEDKDLNGQKEAPKRNNVKVCFLYCLVLFSIVISLAALAVAITSILWSNQQVTQYQSMADCLVELLMQNELFCGNNCSQLNGTANYSIRCLDS